VFHSTHRDRGFRTRRERQGHHDRGNTFEVSPERDGGRLRANGHAIELIAAHGHEAELRIDGRTAFVPYVIDGTTVSFATTARSTPPT